MLDYFLHLALPLLLDLLLLQLFVPSPSVILLADHQVFEQAVHEVLTHIFIALHVEFVVVVPVVEVAMEAGLKREAIDDVELLPQDDSGRLELGCLQSEATGVVSELLSLFRKELGDDPHLEVV